MMNETETLIERENAKSLSLGARSWFKKYIPVFSIYADTTPAITTSFSTRLLVTASLLPSPTQNSPRTPSYTHWSCPSLYPRAIEPMVEYALGIDLPDEVFE